MPYIPHTEQDIREMLRVIGIDSVEGLFPGIPADLRLKTPLKLPAALSEPEITRHLAALANKNLSADKAPFFLGAGCYHHFIPAVVNHLAGRSEFYTAYTPYQPEASQGMLQAFFEYQTMICALTAMDVANASLYDGATALTEATLMALAVTGREKVILAGTIHPEYRAVVRTYLKDLRATVVEVAHQDGTVDMTRLKEQIDTDTACVAFQSPNFFGMIEEAEMISGLAHAQGALVISVTNPISLGLLKPPGEYGADIAVDEGQVLGNEMAFGGPHLGIFTAKKEYVRKMPGRLVGETVDANGKRGFVLTLSTREQHIRREKATSNICSNEGLCALRAAIYLSALGKQGIRTIAEQCLYKAHYAAKKIAGLKGFKVRFDKPFFNEFVIQCPQSPEQINRKLLKTGIIGGLPLGQHYPELKDCILFCVTEMNSQEDIDRLIKVLSK